MSYRQKRFIPNDSLSVLARKIAESKEVTRFAHFRCWENFYPDKEPVFLDKICEARGLKIREDNVSSAYFTNEELKTDWKEWNKFGREDLRSRILRPFLITKLDLGQSGGNA